MTFNSSPINIGSRREVFWDDFLLETENNGPAGIFRITEQAEILLQEPQKKEIVLRLDKPWEGKACGYFHYFHDGEKFRFYYRASAGLSAEPHGISHISKKASICVIISDDGIHWERPDLGLVEFNGNKNNNIIFSGDELDNFFVFKDANPACRPDELYKAITQGRRTPEQPSGGLLIYVSPDGFSWQPASSPIRGLDFGSQKHFFDSLNTAHWDPVIGMYRLYYRGFHEAGNSGRFRDIRLALSPDFYNWEDKGLLCYGAAGDIQLYTNGILPYCRAPQRLVGFPVRYTERKWEPMFDQLPHREWRLEKMNRFSEPRLGTALTDCLFMTGNDGINFTRYDEAFLKPGIFGEYNWVYGDCYQGWGLLETRQEDSGTQELSFFAGEDYTSQPVGIRRYTIRPDGFACLCAGDSERQIVTKPFIFSGNILALNMSTSAAGFVMAEFLYPDGSPVSGFSGESGYRMFGDNLEIRTLFRRGNKDSGGTASSDVSSLEGKPVRIRFTLRDAKLYSMCFSGAGL